MQLPVTTNYRWTSSMDLAWVWPSGREKVYDAGSPMRTFAEDPTLPLGMVNGSATIKVAMPKIVAARPSGLTNRTSPAMASAVGGTSVAYCSARARLVVNSMQTATTADTSDLWQFIVVSLRELLKVKLEELPLSIA
ncbi:MAG: hypothetical protein ACREUI_00040 [Burkholderiales bacterium]